MRWIGSNPGAGAVAIEARVFRGTDRFLLLYLVCLGACLGVLRIAESWKNAQPLPPPPPREIARIMALPPRPDGVRESSGTGEDGERSHYTEQDCRSMDGEFRDICFQALARQRADTDLDGGVLACAEIVDSEKKEECLSDVGELHAPVDREASLRHCDTIESAHWRDQCVFGVSLALVADDPVYAFRLCDDAGQWYEYCRHDVNGEIAVVDLDHALENCAREEGDLLVRKTCWHGIGKYIARVDPTTAFAACEQVPLGPQNLYRENCVHGLGWGASETRAEAFADECFRAGEQEDSCLLGVAYQIARFENDDPVVAFGLCERVERGDLRRACEDWVRR